MDKLKLLKTLDKISYIAIINATVFVLLFQYAAATVALYVSLFSYIVAFLTCFLFCFFRFYYASVANENETELVLKKTQKFWILIKLALSLILLVVGLIVFIMW